MRNKRKTFEQQGKLHREIIAKMLLVVGKKLDLMNPAELSQGHVTEWIETTIRADRDVMDIVSKSNGEGKQGRNASK